MDTNNIQKSPLGQISVTKTGVLVVLVVLVLLAVGFFYVINSGAFGTRQSSPNVPVGTGAGNPVGKLEERSSLVRPDFTYKVKLISADTIVLEGKNGDFTLPNDPASVKAYAGLTKDSPELPLSQLKVGDNVNMEFVPGQSATLFVSQM